MGQRIMCDNAQRRDDDIHTHENAITTVVGQCWETAANGLIEGGGGDARTLIQVPIESTGDDLIAI